MTRPALESALACLRRTAEAAPTDRQLLDRFLTHADQAAYAALVRRHGGRVLAACRRVLADPADIDDAFQATFLVLLHKAGSIRWHPCLGGWLAAVAHRMAVRAQDAARRRKRHEESASAPEQVTAPDPSWREAVGILHQELDRLPDQFRLPLVLCYLEGKSRDEAAAQLGWSAGSVKGRLERGRLRLRKRLQRRGIDLSAGLLAVLAGNSRADVVPRRLVEVASQLAGGAAAPTAVTALAATAMRATIAGPAAFVGGLAILGVVITVTSVGREPIDPAEPPSKPQVVRATPTAEEPITYGGRVLGPDGQPVAGAKVYYLCMTHADEPIPVRAVTDGEGRFAFSIGRKDVPPSADATENDPRKTGQVVAKADGFTFAWQTRPPKPGELELGLSRDDASVEGRLVDLQGKPVAGLRVSAQSAAAPKTGNLGDLVKALRAGGRFVEAVYTHAPNWLNEPLVGRALPGILPATTTDVDGRFRLSGFAREWAVVLRIEGVGIENEILCVLNRPGLGGRRLLTPTFAATTPGSDFDDGRKMAVFGNGFVQPVAPGQTIVGVIKDDATGQSVPRAVVESYQLAGTILAQNTIYRTVADGQGRYRLEGLPRGKGNRIRIRSPEDSAYLPVVKDVPTAAPFAEATVDAALRRGIRVEISATDKNTGRPVPGSVSYFPLPPKRTFIPLPGGDAYDNFMPTRTDGTLRFTIAPGKAVIAFRTDWEKYPIPREAATIWLPSGLSPTNYAAFATIDPKDGDGPVRIDFKLDGGRIVTGKLIGPAGDAVANAWAAPLRTDWWPFDNASVLKSDTFRAIGVDPARPRLLCFVQRERKLAGSVVARGDEPGPVTVPMRPWAVVSGRLLDADGQPIRKARLAFVEVPINNPGRPMSTETGLPVVLRAAGQPELDPKTDDNGRFRADGLVPGLKYNLARYDDAGATGFDEIRWHGLAFRGLVLKPGEDRDLGDVRLQPFPAQ